MSSRSRMPFGKSGYFHRQEIDTSKPLPVGDRPPMSSTNRAMTAPVTADRDLFVQRNEEEMLDRSDHRPANDTMLMDENRDEEGLVVEEEEETTGHEDATMADNNMDNDLVEMDDAADEGSAATVAKEKAKKQRYEQILQNAVQWVEEMEDVKWELQVTSIHNNILLDHMAMQGLDG